MNESTHKTPKALDLGGSRFAKVIPSYAYNPRKKSPSRRDKHRMEVAQRKAKQ